MWIKNTSGKPDAALTFAVIAFAAVTLNIFLATFGSLSIGGINFGFTPLDSGTMGVYLAATFSTYVGRRLTDKMYPAQVQEIMLEDDITESK